MLVFSRRLSSRLTLVLLRWLALEVVVAAAGVAGDVDADADVVVVSLYQDLSNGYSTLTRVLGNANNMPLNNRRW